MNRHVNAIAGRLSLRQPQRHSLEVLDRITEIVPPRKGIDLTQPSRPSERSFRQSQTSSANFRHFASLWRRALGRRG